MADAATAPLVDDGDGDIEQQTGGAFVHASYSELINNFLMMGWTAFGGPQAHIGMFETTFIQKLKWMSETVFMELFALAACLPGPTSTQVSFALGAVKRGIPGGLLGGILFQHPGLIMMTLVGVGAAHFLQESHHWTRATVDGLAAVGVALVAVAAKGLVAKAAKGPLTSMLLLLSACISFVYSAPWLFPALILAGGCVTLTVHTVQGRKMAMAATTGEGDGVVSYGLSRPSGAALLALWLLVLGGAAAARRLTDYGDHAAQPAHWFEAFYRVGSLIYGGGQVVLPMLIQETVQKTCEVVDGVRRCHEAADTWVTEEQFKAGLALIHAMPGPMFNLSAYLGAVAAVRAGWNPLVGVAACWLGLFGPGIMLMYGLLPFWGGFRASEMYRRALPGLNAAAVGLVVMAVFSMYNSFTVSAVIPRTTVAIGMAGFCLVDSVKWPAPAVVVLGGALGAAAGILNFP